MNERRLGRYHADIRGLWLSVCLIWQELIPKPACQVSTPFEISQTYIKAYRLAQRMFSFSTLSSAISLGEQFFERPDLPFSPTLWRVRAKKL